MVIEKKSLLIGILIGAVLLVAINSLTSADLRLSPDCPCSGDTTNPCLDGETYNPEDGSCSSGDGTGATGETGCQFEIYTYDGTFMGCTNGVDNPEDPWMICDPSDSGRVEYGYFISTTGPETTPLCYKPEDTANRDMLWIL